MNVLSIDIDYAFSPSISAYDDHIVGSSISLEEQFKICESIGATPKVNNAKLKILKRIVFGIDAPVIIGTHHHEILNHLPLDSKLTIFNFDHHHDIFYPGWHLREELDEGNWISHLPNLERYVWIRNLDSENLDPSVQFDFDYEEVIDTSRLFLPKIDLIFGCCSPHWTMSFGRKYLLEVLCLDHD
tara:strand:+ start:103 stop:660 length:558 start_codon:yes stop_codon:yes gene_type:complete